MNFFSLKSIIVALISQAIRLQVLHLCKLQCEVRLFKIIRKAIGKRACAEKSGEKLNSGHEWTDRATSMVMEQEVQMPKKGTAMID